MGSRRLYFLAALALVLVISVGDASAAPSPEPAAQDTRPQIMHASPSLAAKTVPNDLDNSKDQPVASSEEQKKGPVDATSHSEQVLSRAAANDGLLNAAGSRVGEVGIAATAPVAPEIMLDEESRPVEVEHEGEVDPSQQHRNNFASEAAGAVIMASNPEMTGVAALLGDNADSYALSRCDVKKYVIVGLSEDVLVDTLIVSNEEKYSSTIKQFRVLGAQKYPAAEWIVLGNFTAANILGEQLFPVTVRSWVRYLKINWLSHYGDEFYCTWTRVKVHGSTILEDLQQQVQSSEAEVHAARQQLQLEAALRASGGSPPTHVPTLSAAPAASAAQATTSAALPGSSIPTAVAMVADSSLDVPVSGVDSSVQAVGGQPSTGGNGSAAWSDTAEASHANASSVSPVSSTAASAQHNSSVSGEVSPISATSATAHASSATSPPSASISMGTAVEAVPSVTSSVPSPSISMPAVPIHPTPAPPVPGMLGQADVAVDGSAHLTTDRNALAMEEATPSASVQAAVGAKDTPIDSSVQPHTAEQAVLGMLDALDASSARADKEAGGRAKGASAEQELDTLHALAAGLEAHASQLEISADAALQSIAAQAAGAPSLELAAGSTPTVPGIPAAPHGPPALHAPTPSHNPTPTADVTPVLVPVPPSPSPSPSPTGTPSNAQASPSSAVSSGVPGVVVDTKSSKGAGEEESETGAGGESSNSSDTVPAAGNSSSIAPVELASEPGSNEDAAHALTGVTAPHPHNNSAASTMPSLGMLEASAEASMTAEEALAAAAANLTLATLSSSPVPKPLPDTSAPLLPQGQEGEAGEGSEDAEAQAVAALTAVNIPRLSADLASSSKSAPGTQQTHTANVFKTLTRKIADLEIDNTLVHSYLTDMHGRYTAAVAALSRSTGAVRHSLAQLREDLAGVSGQLQSALGNGSMAHLSAACGGGTTGQGTAVPSTGAQGSAAAAVSSSSFLHSKESGQGTGAGGGEGDSDVSKTVAGLEKSVARVERALASITRVLIRHMREGGIEVSLGDGGVLRRADEPVGWDTDDSQAAGTALVPGGFAPGRTAQAPRANASGLSTEGAALAVLPQQGASADGAHPPHCPACPGSDCEPAIPCLVPPIPSADIDMGIPPLAPGALPPPHVQAHPEVMQAWYRQMWGHLLAWVRGTGMRRAGGPTSGGSSAGRGAGGPHAWAHTDSDPVLTQQMEAMQGELQGLKAELSAATAAAQQAVQMALWCTAATCAVALALLTALCCQRRGAAAATPAPPSAAGKPVVDELIDITRHSIRRVTPGSTPTRERMSSLAGLPRGSGEGNNTPSPGAGLTSPPRVGPTSRVVAGAASMPSPQPLPAGRGHMANPAVHGHVPAPGAPKASGGGMAGSRLSTPAAVELQGQGTGHSHGPGTSHGRASGTFNVSPSSVSTQSVPADREQNEVQDTSSEGSAPA